MNEPNYFNDAPILSPDDDRFGIDPFAQALSRSIREIRSPIGATIALNGKWGSGKSSAINLIRHHLAADVKAGKLEIIDFKCWWFRGQEALTLAFLQELNATLRKSLSKKAKKLIPQLGKILLQAGPVIGPAINVATGGPWGSMALGSMNFAKRFFPEGKSVEILFHQLSKALEEQDKRFLVLIDDIDRLMPDEAVLVFRLVKSVGRLPNLIYLLAFDRELAEKAVKEKYPSEGPHFLEKIIQACFELPNPPRDDLNRAALSQIETLCGSPKDHNQLRRFMNIFYDAVSPYLNIPRDITRLSNAMAISWPPVAGEVDVADYVALEMMRLSEPKLYNFVRSNKDRVCGVRSTYANSEDPEKEIQSFLDLVPEQRREHAKATLIRLFPRFENVSYGSDFPVRWEAQRLVCAEKHFDTYFRMSIGDETLSMDEINEFIERCGDGAYVKQAFLEARSSVRKNGKSKVPLLFDEVNTHASRVEKHKFESLISAIFEIADDIDRDEDREGGGFSFGDNYLRIHWLIRRLTFDRCDLSERSRIFLSACQNAHVGWLVDFVNSSVADYFPREDGEPEPPEKCLVEKESLAELKTLAIKAIETAAGNGELLSHPKLAFILFRWREFADDDSAGVKTWANAQLADDVAIAQLAKAFTGESWSQSLGDRVSMRHTRAGVGGLETILDVGMFRERLEELESSNALDNPHKENVQTFLKAWREKESGKDF
ncbi:MAG: P-loop NTPase fold protein [Alphaproteobacteria bacterium]|nr:P-loop NTPase fold protein [Alphaproteobacteria bacterium]